VYKCIRPVVCTQNRVSHHACKRACAVTRVKIDSHLSVTYQ
jgi:hypothetical protein